MRYFIYARKSTDSEDRQVMSIDAQLAELDEFAAREKLEIAASLSETKTAQRHTAEYCPFNNPKTKSIDVDVEKAGAVRKAFETYSTGENTLKQIEQFFAAAQITYKGKHLSVSSVQQILKTCFATAYSTSAARCTRDRTS